MTCDTGEYNDPYKIDINLVNDRHSKRTMFFAKGLGALLADPFFLLLHVPANGGRMQVIRPARDSKHRKRVIKMINKAKHIPSFYYALSHLWGLNEDNRYLWYEIGDHVDDEEGQPMKPVSMRPEKRDALLALLRNHPGSYWWIDILCARTDTPLDIMGDIYSCCLKCIAMIDCEPTLISAIRTASDAVVKAEERMKRTGKTKKRMKRTGKTYLSYLLNCIRYHWIRRIKGPQLIGLLDIFLQSKWWQRVWTWQEMALPVADVRFMAETDIHRLQTNTITLNELLGFRSLLPSLRSDILLKNDSRQVSFEVGRRLEDITYARRSNDLRIELGWGLPTVLRSLSHSKRQCYDPCDYVYGVLGMLKIKIPRMDDPNAVWRRFLAELDSLYPPHKGKRWIDLAGKRDLRKAENIGQVYKSLEVLLSRLYERYRVPSKIRRRQRR